MKKYYCTVNQQRCYYNSSNNNNNNLFKNWFDLFILVDNCRHTLKLFFCWQQMIWFTMIHITIWSCLACVALVEKIQSSQKNPSKYVKQEVVNSKQHICWLAGVFCKCFICSKSADILADVHWINHLDWCMCCSCLQ